MGKLIDKNTKIEGLGISDYNFSDDSFEEFDYTKQKITSKSKREKAEVEKKSKESPVKPDVEKKPMEKKEEKKPVDLSVSEKNIITTNSQTIAIPVGYRVVPESKNKQITALIPQSIYDMIKQYGAEHGMSLNAFVNEAIIEYINKINR